VVREIKDRRLQKSHIQFRNSFEKYAISVA